MFYYIDADPMDPRNGKETFRRYDVGLQLSVVFRKERFQWGVEANIGLLPVSALNKPQDESMGPFIHLVDRKRGKGQILLQE